MRDYLSHGYDDIQYVTLWDALCLHVPDLEATVVKMLADLGEDETSKPSD